MKSTKLIIFVGILFHSALSLGYDLCQNPNGRRVSELALAELRSNILPDEEALDHARLDPECGKFWFDDIFMNFTGVDGGYYSGCGISVPLPHEVAKIQFALNLYAANGRRDFVPVQDIFATISVPICGYVESPKQQQP